MKLSRESEYGLAGLAYLARRRPGTVVQLKDIARAQALPAMFLAKTFRKLTHHGVLASFRGRLRGYALARPPRQISVREVLEGIEGRDVFTRCIFWSNRCSDQHPCTLHPVWQSLRPRVTAAMERLTLEQVARGPRAARSRPGARSRSMRGPGEMKAMGDLGGQTS